MTVTVTVMVTLTVIVTAKTTTSIVNVGRTPPMCDVMEFLVRVRCTTYVGLRRQEMVTYVF